MFIPTSLQVGGGGGSSFGSSSFGTRHYRSYQPTTTIKNETKKNKRVKEEMNIWAKIEEDFMPAENHG